MKKGIALLGIGAGLMYLLDPEQGETRRSQLRDMFSGFLPQTTDAVGSKTEALTAQASTLAEKVDTLAAEKISALVPDAPAGGEEGGEQSEGAEKQSEPANNGASA